MKRFLPLCCLLFLLCACSRTPVEETEEFAPIAIEDSAEITACYFENTALYAIFADGSTTRLYDCSTSPELDPATAELLGVNQYGVYFQASMSDCPWVFAFRFNGRKLSRLFPVQDEQPAAVLAGRWLCLLLAENGEPCDQLLLYDTDPYHRAPAAYWNLSDLSDEPLGCTVLRADGEQLILERTDGSSLRLDLATSCVLDTDDTEQPEPLPAPDIISGDWVVTDDSLLYHGSVQLTLSEYNELSFAGMDPQFAAEAPYTKLHLLGGTEHGAYLAFDNPKRNATEYIYWDADTQQALCLNRSNQSMAFTGQWLLSFQMQSQQYAFLAVLDADTQIQQCSLNLAALCNVQSSCTCLFWTEHWLYFGYENGAILCYDPSSGCAFKLKDADGTAIAAVSVQGTQLLWRTRYQHGSQIASKPLPALSPSALPCEAVSDSTYSIENNFLLKDGTPVYDLSQIDQYTRLSDSVTRYLGASLFGSNDSGAYFTVYVLCSNASGTYNSSDHYHFVFHSGAAAPEQLAPVFQAIGKASTVLLTDDLLISLCDGRQLHIYDTLANAFFGDKNGTFEIGDLSGEESRCTALCADIGTLYLAYENGAIVQYDIRTAASTALVASSGVAIDALSWKDGSLFWRYRSQEGDAVYTHRP